MMIVVTEETKAIFPPAVRRKARIRAGTKLEVRLEGGVVSFARASERATNGEYTAAQRKEIDAALTEARKGPAHGPFRNGDEIAAYLKSPKVTKLLEKHKTPR